MDEQLRDRADAFDGMADTYGEYRPDYPEEAIRWLVGDRRATVLELGAGTGKLTRALLSLGHTVIASDPGQRMVSTLRSDVPGAKVVTARAEDIPLRSSSVDVVVAGQAFHWFEQEHALPEIARVLRPGGVLGLAWNYGDTLVPWVRRVFDLVGGPERRVERDPVEGSDLFEPSDQRVFRHWQQVFRDSLIGFVRSNSGVAVMSPEGRDRVLAQAAALYDSYGRGYDGMLMPWKSYCFRTRVTGLANYRRESVDSGDDDLLIDFS